MRDVGDAFDGTAQAGLWQRDGVGRALHALSAWTALTGGLVLVAMIALSIVSVLGRWLADSPVQGDFELVQLGCAACVACFLPLCQLEKGHVAVDFFTMRAGPRVRAWLDAAGATLLGLCAAVLAWRLAVGAWDVWSYGDTTMILDVPKWYAYAPMVVAFALLALTGWYGAWAEWRNRGRG
ncbi:MAG: TRAP transporter small permease subunit [Betaproteobacteria bacterium]|nr:TRAP transporter small permease subunit [Betaproteobacteria bacterium]